jgi:hypothetical protein
MKLIRLSRKGLRMSPRNACADCQGDGKCVECNGTSTNTHLK